MNFADFYRENSHVNEVTGCVIWDGDTTRVGPIVSGMNMQVRKAVYDSVNGPQLSRTKYSTSCENPLCVKMEHIVAIAPEKQAHSYPEDRVKEVVDLHSQGLRQDFIAEKMGIDASTVSKYLKYARERQEEK